MDSLDIHPAIFWKFSRYICYLDTEDLKGSGQIRSKFYILKELKKIEKATKAMLLQSVVKYLFQKGIYSSSHTRPLDGYIF